MDKVLVGAITSTAEVMLRKYLDAFMPDVEIKPLSVVGIKSTLKNRGARADTVLIILDENLWLAAAGVCDDVLSMSKVHKYVTDDGLSEFLISKFGRLDDALIGTPPPDQLLAQQGGRSSDIISTIADDDTDFGSDFRGMSDVEDTSQEIADLKAKIEADKTIIRNLEQQLRDSGSVSDDIALLLSRIRELEEQLENQKNSSSGEDYETLGKLAKAEKVLEEFDSLKAQVKTVREEKASLEYDKSVLTTKITDLESKLATAQESDVALIDLRKEVEIKQNDVSRLTLRVSELEDTIVEKDSELASTRSEMEVIQQQLSKQGVDTAVVSDLRERLSDKESEYSSLQIDLDTANHNLDKAKAELSELRLSLKEKEAKLDELTESYEESKNRVIELEEQAGVLNSQIARLSKSIESKDTELNGYCQRESELRETIRSLQSNTDLLTSRDSEIKMLSGSIEDQKVLIENLTNSLREAKDSLTETQNQLKQVTERALMAEDSAEINKNAYEDALSKKKAVEDKINDMREQVRGLEEQVDKLEAEVSERKEQYSQLSSEKLDVEAQLRKSETQRTAMQAELIDAKTGSEQVSRLESDLMEERRKSARLAAENEVLKKSGDSDSSEELRNEIMRLQSELDRAKDTATAGVGVEVTALKAELADTRSRCADLELDLVDKNAQLAELSTGVFARMASIAIPKAVYDVSLPALEGDFSKVVCMASGSDESNQSLYANMRKACSMSNKHIIVLDLTTDSSIDREFGISRIQSPIDWLSGAEPFKNYLADTKFGNVKVLSVALAYFNNLFLMNVDWSKRLQELATVAHVVVVNVGCLNSVISKVLFNTFSRSMKSYVVAKATPINLRATILNLTGIKNISTNVTTICVNFNDKASKDMYQRLSQKFKAQILTDADAIPL